GMVRLREANPLQPSSRMRTGFGKSTMAMVPTSQIHCFRWGAWPQRKHSEAVRFPPECLLCPDLSGAFFVPLASCRHEHICIKGISNTDQVAPIRLVEVLLELLSTSSTKLGFRFSKASRT